MNEHGKKETTRWEAQPMPDRRQWGTKGERMPHVWRGF